jgi:hypothetical protein
MPTKFSALHGDIDYLAQSFIVSAGFVSFINKGFYVGNTLQSLFNYRV